MKRFRCFFAIIFASMLALTDDVFATSFSFSIVGDDTFSNVSYLSLHLGGSALAGGACGGVCGVTANLSYDSSKIELMGVSASQGMDFTQGATLVLYKATAANDGSILNFSFRNIGLSNGESTIVYLNNIVASNGDQDMSYGGISRRITYSVPVTPTPADIGTPTHDGATPLQNQNISVDNKRGGDLNQDGDIDGEGTEIFKSSNANLSDIQIDNGELFFEKDVLVFDVVTEKHVEKITIEAIAEDTTATVFGNDTYDLLPGANKIEITVMAEDGSSKIYTVNVYREEYTAYERELMNKNTVLIIVIITISVLLLAAICYIVYSVLTRSKSAKSCRSQKTNKF